MWGVEGMESSSGKKEKLLLAYSGGLDTSVICRWLTEKGYEVICFVADVGQREDFSSLEKKALNSGAAELVVANVQEDFVNNFIAHSIAFNARYEGVYLLGTALARPAIAQAMVLEAKKRGLSCYGHGATGKGNDQVRFEFAIYALHSGDTPAKIIAPFRNEEFCATFRGRKDMIEYAKKYDIPVKATAERPWSSDENLFHLSFESGMLEDPSVAPLEEMYELTQSPQDSPKHAEELTIDFFDGLPCALNGKKMSFREILIKLNELGGKHGIGRVDMVESRFVGMKSRGVYETPGGTILLAAHRDIESLTLPGGLTMLKERLSCDFSLLVYNGKWFSREMECLLAFLKESQKYVAGRVSLSLYKGQVIIHGRESQFSLYDEKKVSMEDDGGAYTPQDAQGFIKINALSLTQSSLQKTKKAKKSE